MGLLGRIKQLISENEKPAEVTRVMAPLSGEIVPLDTVPDAVFAGKIVGDGIAILSVLPEWPSNRVDELLPWNVALTNK